MSDPGDTNLIEFKGWTLRTRESTQPSPRLLLLIHGLTGDENSMWVFTQGLPKHYWMIAPRAPHTAEPFGYSWRTIQPGTAGRPTFDQLLPAAEALVRFMDEYQASAGIDADSGPKQRIDVMGFSQGAAMTSVLAFLYPHRIRKVGMLSGFVPTGVDAYIPGRPLEGRNIFIAHGTKDDTVPVDKAQASIEILKQAGAEITYCEDDVGHKVSLNCLRALRSYLED
jgi:phospholipase/carboxylesterase